MAGSGGSVVSHRFQRVHLCRSLFRLVEHDGLWVLVHHLSHVSQDVLLGDDAQETPGQTKEVSGHFRRFYALIWLN